MSADWEVSNALALAQLQATITRADAGAGNARVRLYTTARPATISAAHSDTPQAEVVLAKPCAVIVSGVLTLQPRDAAGSMVMHNGLPRWGEWVAADGAVLARADVTDTAHDGGLQVAGADTPAGETSPLLLAGGLVQLGATALM